MKSQSEALPCILWTYDPQVSEVNFYGKRLRCLFKDWRAGSRTFHKWGSRSGDIRR